MKYKTFVLLRNVGGVGLATLAAVGAFLGCRNAAQSNSPSVTPPAYNPPATQRTPKPVANRPAAKTAEPVPTGATAPLSGRDSAIITLQKEPLTRGKPAGDSARWLSVGDGFKAEFRADAGSRTWNRAKVDLDADKKWDEKWDFKDDGSIKRRVSPADDDNYTAEYRLKSGETKWTRAK